jgi:signal transduction histidine kinase
MAAFNRKKTVSLLLKYILLLVLFTHASMAQTPRLDSILNAVKYMREDTAKVNAFYEISRIYLIEYSNVAKVGEYGRKQLLLAKKLNFKKGIAQAMLNVAIFYRDKSEYDLALYYDRSSLQLMREIGNKKGESHALGNIGLTFSQKGEYKQALEYMKSALEIKKAIGDKRGIAITNNNMANIFQTQGNYTEAMAAHLTSLKIREELGDKNGIAASYNNIGTLLYSQEKFDESLKYYLKAVKIWEEYHDLTGLSQSFGNIGNIYRRKKQYKEAVTYMLKESMMSEQLGNKHGLAVSYNNIASVYLDQNKPNIALKYDLKAYELSKQIEDKRTLTQVCGSIAETYEAKKDFTNAIRYNLETLELGKETGSRESNARAYSSLASIYKKLGQYDIALKYNELYGSVKDSLLNKENFRQVAELNTRYETEKKEKEILLLTKDRELNAKIIHQQQAERWALIIGIALLGVTILGVYRRYRFKQKANVILEQQKQEIELTVMKLTQAKDELHKAVEQKEKLTSILAHDLRTPLRFISTVSGYLHRNASTIGLKELEELSGELSTSSKGTFALADELLTWLSIQGHNLKVTVIKVDIKKVLDELTAFFSDIAKMKNVQLSISFQQPFFVDTDEKLVKIILRNVLDNAIKNTVNGAIELSVSAQETGFVTLQIHDTGKGMTMEQLEKLNRENALGFPFGISDKLGFQIVKDLTLLLKGKILVKSELGKGTTVILNIPSEGIKRT